MIATVLGGVGLFLLGMWLLAEGLRLAAGPGLRDALGRWTARPARAFATGLGLTGLVQSSSVVSMAVVSFANAGLLALGPAVWTIYGANVGATAIGWIVQLVGFRIDLGAVAMPAIGIGMALKLFGRDRVAALGQALAGFGALFLGIDALKTGFEGAATRLEIPGLAGDGPGALAVYMGAGLVLTVAMQSSSAFLVVAMTALASGLVTPSHAAAMTLGASIGTTTDAILAAIGGTPTAKRVATAHVLFAALSSALGFALLHPLLGLLTAAEAALAPGAGPGLVLVAFYTATKLLGVLAIWPLTPALIRFLERRFVIPEGNGARLRYLDRAARGAPGFALEAAARETGRLRDQVAGAIGAWLDAPQDDAPLRAAAPDARLLADRIAAVLADLSRGPLAADEVGRVQTLMRTLQHYLAALEDARFAAAHRPGGPGAALERDELDAAARAAVVAPERLTRSLEADLKDRRDALKEGMLARAAAGALPLDALDAHLRGMNATLRMLRHLRKGRTYLAEFAGPPDRPLGAPEDDPAA